MRRLSSIATALALAAAAPALAQEFKAVLTRTSFGEAWILRLVLAAALVATVVLAPRDDWTTLAILSGLGLASLALVGHATMQSGPEGIVHRVNHALHLVSTGAWLGGLIPVLCLDADAKSDLKRNAVEAMTRFSFFGHFVVRRSWRRELSTSRLSRPARRCRRRCSSARCSTRRSASWRSRLGVKPKRFRRSDKTG
jgi:putative copper export protein